MHYNVSEPQEKTSLHILHSYLFDKTAQNIYGPQIQYIFCPP